MREIWEELKIRNTNFTSIDELATNDNYTTTSDDEILKIHGDTRKSQQTSRDSDNDIALQYDTFPETNFHTKS